MSRPGLVSNSSPLIFLSAASDLHLLRAIFDRIAIPRAVWNEVVLEGQGLPGAAEIQQAAGHWLTVLDAGVPSQISALMRQHKLQIGETEAIVLAEKQECPVLLDEQRAVRYARSRGQRVVRTPMLYATAKSQGLIPSVRAKLDLLRTKRFFLKDEDYSAILRMAGET